MPIPEITEDIIHLFATGRLLAKGYEYYENGAVEDVKIQNGAYIVHVQGSELRKILKTEKALQS
jgi:uncharacterized Zn finger protein